MGVDAAVIGAGGKTGQRCVEELLRRGKTVKAVVRSPDKYKDVYGQRDGLQLVKGDVTNAASLESALAGAKGVIFAASGTTYWSAGAVDRQGVQNTVDAARKAGAQQVVLVSSALVTPQNRFHPIRVILNNIRWGLMDAKFAGENLLRGSGMPFTVVRPGGLTDGEAGKAKLVATQGDKGGAGRVRRADVAAVCAAALTDPRARGITLELKADAQQPAGDSLAALFEGLQQGVFQ